MSFADHRTPSQISLARESPVRGGCGKESAQYYDSYSVSELLRNSPFRQKSKRPQRPVALLAISGCLSLAFFRRSMSLDGHTAWTYHSVASLHTAFVYCNAWGERLEPR